MHAFQGILWEYFGFILERYHCFWVAIDHRNAQVYSTMLISSDVSWYHDTFGVMHPYSCTLYHPISNT